MTISRSAVRSVEQFTHKLYAHILSTAEVGHGGVSREYVVAGLRPTMYGKYCIYFRQDDTTMTVLRVLQAARDISLIDFNGSRTRR